MKNMIIGYFSLAVISLATFNMAYFVYKGAAWTELGARISGGAIAIPCGLYILISVMRGIKQLKAKRS